MDYAYFDRSYRLRMNRGQVRVDRAAYTGLGAGMITAAATGSRFGVLGGGATGLIAGTLAGAVYNMAMSKKS